MDFKMKVLLLLSLSMSTWAGIAPLYETPKVEALYLAPEATFLQPKVGTAYLPPAPPQTTTTTNSETSCLESRNKISSPVQETYKKEFYAFSAPEEEFEDSNAAQKIAAAIQKNLRVIFIRAPEQKGLEHAALHLAKHITDDKTAIYVLNKQHDLSDLANRLTTYREQYSQKPTVQFVKYRTAAEAEQAQQTIQAQYDLLRGSTHTSNEGAAPVLDFSSKQQLPSYGSAISIVPAFNSGSSSNNNVGLYGQPIVSKVPTIPNIESYTQQSTLTNTPTIPIIESYNPQPIVNNVPTISNIGSYNQQSVVSNTPTASNFGSYSLQSSGYTNSVSSSNSYSSILGPNAPGAGFPGVSVLPVDNNAYVPPPLDGHDIDPRSTNRRTVRSDPVVSKLNERKNNNSKMVFPSEKLSKNTI